MIIDSKLPGFKSYLSENRLNNGGVKTTINQSAVAASEQNNVDLELKDDTNSSQDDYNKKKNEEEHSQNNDKQKEKPTKQLPNETEVKKRNLKLLNLL